MHVKSVNSHLLFANRLSKREGLSICNTYRPEAVQLYKITLSHSAEYCSSCRASKILLTCVKLRKIPIPPSIHISVLTYPILPLLFFSQRSANSTASLSALKSSYDVKNAGFPRSRTLSAHPNPLSFQKKRTFEAICALYITNLEHTKAARTKH